MLVSLFGSGDTLRQYVTDILVRLDSVVHGAQLHVVIRVSHLLLLKQELLLLLLLEHALLQDLLQLNLDLLRKRLNRIAIFIGIVAFSEFFGILHVRSILQKLNYLLGRQIIRNITNSIILNVALCNHLLSLLWLLILLRRQLILIILLGLLNDLVVFLFTEFLLLHLVRLNWDVLRLAIGSNLHLILLLVNLLILFLSHL